MAEMGHRKPDISAGHRRISRMFGSFCCEIPTRRVHFSGLSPLEKHRTDFLSGRESLALPVVGLYLLNVNWYDDWSNFSTLASASHRWCSGCCLPDEARSSSLPFPSEYRLQSALLKMAEVQYTHFLQKRFL